jgi:hypothetical protein
MRKFLIGLVALFFTMPAFASLDHWVCSNESTVMYMALNTGEGSFVLWDDKGGFLAAAEFTDKSETKDGTPFLVAELDSGVLVGVAKVADNKLVLAIASNAEEKATRFICQ